MEPLDPRLRELVDRGMREAIPDDATQARSLARLLAALPPTLPGPGIDAPDPSVAATATAGKLSLKLIVGLALGVTAAGTVGVIAVQPDEVAHVDAPAPETKPVVARPRSAPTEPGSPRPEAAPAPAPIAEPSVAPALAPARRAPPPAVRGAAPPPSDAAADALFAETSLIAVADAALERGDARAALTVLREHAMKFPQGQLALDRRGLELAAGCVLAPGSNRDDVAAFLRRHGRSGAAVKVRSRCEKRTAK